MKFFYINIIIVIIFILASSCDDEALIFPKVNYDRTYSGRAGEILTISGSDFNTLPSEYTISISDVIAEVTETSDDFLKIKIPENISNGSIFLRYNENNTISVGEFTLITYLNDFLTGYSAVSSMNDFLGKWMDSTEIYQYGLYHYSQIGAESGEVTVDGSLERIYDEKSGLPYSLDGYLYCKFVNFSNVDSIIFKGDASILIDFDKNYFSPNLGDGEYDNYTVTKYIKYSRLYSDFDLPITIIKKDKTKKDKIKIA